MTDDKKPTVPQIRITQGANDLFEFGPSIPVFIGPCPLANNTLTKVLAQIDTGAAGTGISPRLANKLNLDQIDEGQIHEAGRGIITAKYFRAAIRLPAIDVELDIVGLPSLAEPHDVLLGRDALSQFRLMVDFVDGVTLLRYSPAK